MTSASILSIGDELLIGQVVNTNASWLGERLTDLGLDVRTVVEIGDDRQRIIAELRRLASECDLLVVSGGLGPTEDDLTREAIGELLGCGLTMDAGQLARIERRFADRGIAVNERSRRQALVPEACTTIPNEHGSAPGLKFTLSGAKVIVLPGVPSEFKGILSDHVLPAIASDRTIERRTFLVFGPTESELANRLEEINHLVGGAITRAFLPSPGGIRVRIMRVGGDEEARDRYVQLIREIPRLMGTWLVSDRDETLSSTVGRALRTEGITLATAESCTGGMLGQLITEVAGSSEYYLGGVVAYANAAKVSLIGVDDSLIDNHGAVSRSVAEAMAEGVARALGADIGVSITGIAGPSGGTAEKPVGTVWIAVASKRGVHAKMHLLGREREIVRARAASIALNLVRLEIDALGAG